MKELSIEQKAQRYNEALKRAMRLYEQGTITESLSYIFPELKESEDERIRKCIGDVVREYDWSHIFGVTKDDCLSWLEKQGEQKPTNEEMKTLLRTEYEKGRADAIVEMQNPSWSEEDEEFLRRAINVTKDAYPMTAKWLKSLRTQNKWKPSDVQIKALHDLNLTGNISYAGQGQVLIELYNDLKKLAEE